MALNSRMQVRKCQENSTKATELDFRLIRCIINSGMWVINSFNPLITQSYFKSAQVHLGKLDCLIIICQHGVACSYFF